MIPSIPMAQIHNMFATICVRTGDTFTITDDCLPKLEEILKKLVTEDCNLRTYRRAIGFGQNIRKDLIPLLLHLKHDSKSSIRIIDVTIQILVELTIPIEYLLSMETLSLTDVGRHTIFELNKLLTTSKEAFTDSRNTKIVTDHIKFMVESDFDMNIQRCDSINNCLLLLRNILHIPETKQNQICSSMQNQIIWNLFTQSIDKIIIYLISCPQKLYWDVTMVQLIALLYKDQHVGTLQKLLNLWLEASLSESSEDNESNTSPPEQGSGDDSSPIITSDPTSDSSDGGGKPKRNKPNINSKKTMMMRGKSTETETSFSSGISSGHQNSVESADCPRKKDATISSQSEDFGYVTQVENQESISTSSNEDDQPQRKPVYQKPHCFQKNRFSANKSRTVTALEKKEWRRKKLVKRSKTNTINMKGLMHHLPTDEDISNILKEFTVDFLLKGYSTLVQDLHSHLLSNTLVQIDTSHFFWLVTYFLKFATQLELDLEHVSPVLSSDILSFLVFQGVWIYEEVEMTRRIAGLDLKPSLRRLHLVVTAIREFLQAVESYQKMLHLTEEDKVTLEQLKNRITEMLDLRSLFILLLRQYNSTIQSRQYLQDLIITNHNYLLLLDGATKHDQSFNIMEHLKQFATVDIMRQYGLLLENFKENGEFVNNCIFTMMHHIGGDLENVAALIQPVILKTFSLIWETDYQICDDWSDLIEYIIHKFINTPRPSLTEIPCGNVEENAEWTEEEKDNLLGYYNQSRYSQDTIATITKKYEKFGVKHKTQLSIIRQLLEQKIINQSQYDDFIKENEKPELSEADEYLQNEENPSSVDGGIRLLLDYLYKEEKGKFVRHLQRLLIDVCYVKLFLANPCEFEDNYGALKESVIYHFALLNLPIPVVPWTAELNAALKCQSFVLLLHKLGFYLPIDTGKVFVTIPNFWNAEHAFSISQQLGPVDTSKLKFDVKIFKGPDEQFRNEAPNISKSMYTSRFSKNEVKQAPSMVRYTPLPNSPEWFQTIKTVNNEGSQRSEDGTSHHQIRQQTPCDSPMHEDIEHNSACETASITSDLTRMCVSDEEDKLILVIEQK